jgi:hypothetical protein
VTWCCWKLSIIKGIKAQNAYNSHIWPK